MSQTRPADGMIDYLDAFDRLLQARLPVPEPTTGPVRRSLSIAIARW
ncbi:hypothetical protein [Burkholderia gladioli]|nr:hypothetical protein [Burkholderia gladioli]